MDYQTKQREAFYLIKKYTSVTWHAEAFRLFKQFCEDYERDFYRKPVAGYQATEWDEQNLRMFWEYASEMEDGLAAVRKGDLWGGRGREERDLLPLLSGEGQAGRLPYWGGDILAAGRPVHGGA